MNSPFTIDKVCLLGWLLLVTFSAAADPQREPAFQPGCRSTTKDLSIILPARNDGHGGDFLDRLRNTLLLVTKFPWAEKEVAVEIIVTVWADPANAVPLHVALGLGISGDEENAYWHDRNAAIRFIIVPQELHSQVHNPLQLGLLQYVAKNVGIRRACGHHILITNADCLLPWAMLNNIVIVLKQAWEQEADALSLVSHVSSIRGVEFMLAFRHDLVEKVENVLEQGVLLQTTIGQPVSLQELSGQACDERYLTNIWVETEGFSQLKNIGDFMLIPWKAINVTLAYSEHHHPWGLDGELVCRLAHKHRMRPVLLSPPCAVAHQPHPEAYNYSHPPFPFGDVCAKYVSRQGQKDEHGRQSDEEPEQGVKRSWGHPEWNLTEYELLPNGQYITHQITREGALESRLCTLNGREMSS